MQIGKKFVNHELNMEHISKIYNSNYSVARKQIAYVLNGQRI
jgi:hypothetical protein